MRRQRRGGDVYDFAIISMALLAMCASGQAQEELDGFAGRIFVSQGGPPLPYRIFAPEVTAEKRLPLIVYLHGSGGAGIDNRAQITGGNARGTHLWTAPAAQARHPSFVVAPQIAVGETWIESAADPSSYGNRVVALIAELAQTFPIDRDRIYLIGQSLGGFGVWALIAEHPMLFAAGVPLCGGGDPERIGRARLVPVWAFHGAEDRIVPVNRSRDMVTALRAAGGAVQYTEYPEVGHEVWMRAFAEPLLPEWLFAQQRNQ